MDLFNLFCKISIDDGEYVAGLSDAVKNAKAFSAKIQTATKPIANLDSALDDAGKSAKDTAKEFNKSSDEAKKLGDSFDDASEKTVGFADVLKGSLLSDFIMSGIRALGSAIKSISGDIIDSAATIKAQNSQFEQTFGEFQTQASEAINRVADDSGILETRLNSAATSIYAFARSSGGAVDESMSLMETALQAAADSAAYYDRSLEDTTDTLMSFLKGNFANDAALGVSATETTRNAAAMELFGQKYSDLSEIQKQQTLLKMVTDSQELSGAMGQASREADGWENVQGNLNKTWDQFLAKVGDPVLENLIPIIQDVTDALKGWVDNVDWDAFSENVNGFVSSIMDNGSTIISLITGIGAGFIAWNVVTMIQGLVTAINAFRAANEGATISQIALNLAMKSNPLGLIITAVSTLVAAFVTLVLTNEKFRDGFLAVYDAIIDAFEAVVDFFAEKIQQIKDGFGSLVGGIKSLLGIHSPSRVFAGIGENMALGLGAGWDDEFSRIKGQIEGGMDFGTASMDFATTGLAQVGKMASAAPVATESHGDIVIDFTTVMDSETVAKKVLRYRKDEDFIQGAEFA